MRCLKRHLLSWQLMLALQSELEGPGAGAVLGVHFVVMFLLQGTFVMAVAL